MLPDPPGSDVRKIWKAHGATFLAVLNIHTYYLLT